ncbi:MAG: hypothetical protein AABZ29_06695 [Gemmatimonadota bacterium]
MNGPEVLVPIAFFFTVVALVLGIPLVRAVVRKADRQSLPGGDARTDDRLARIEAAVDAIAIEVERISEGQRFTTKLLSERATLQLPGPTSKEPTS